LLLFTYFIQGQSVKKRNEDINKLSEEEKKRMIAQMNLNTVSKDVYNLNNRIETLEKAILKLKDSKKAAEEEVKVKEDVHLDTVKAYEELIKAENQYLKGNLVECATILLKSCDRKLYDASASEKYDYLVNKTFYKASQQLYFQGLSDYKSKKYNEAIFKFELSLNLNKESYFADDCYYYIAYSYINTGSNEMAKKNLNELLINYPNSTYSNESLRIIKQLPD
jgi:TolA-binding protein